MWLMLQREEPSDYVVGTGRSWSVRQLVEVRFREIVWRGAGIKGVGVDAATETVRVTVDLCICGPTEVEVLSADPARIGNDLGWKARMLSPRNAAICNRIGHIPKASSLRN